MVWARSVGGTGVDYSRKVHTDNFGSIYISGQFNNTVDFDPNAGVFNLSTTNSNTTYILKLDSEANFIWAKMIENTYPQDLITDRSGFLYLTGVYYGLCDFDPGPPAWYLNANFYDMFILKLNSSGNFIWVKSIGGSGYAGINSVFLDSAKNIYATGLFEDTADFDPELPVYELTVDYPTSNPLILKLGQCPTPVFFDTTIITCDTFVLNNVTYTSSGIYKQLLTNFWGSDSTINIHLTINEKPVPNLGGDRKLCGSTRISPGVFDTYLWQDNSVQQTFTVNNGGQYWVTVTNNKNCKASDTVNILAIDTVPHNFLPANQQLCYGNELKITVPGYQNYLWNTGATNYNITIRNFGIYYLHATDYNNCTGTDSITVSRKDCIFIGIPNAFTPNADNKNDIFKPIINQGIKQFRFIIFNRYGQKIFETTDYGEGWDGTYEGKIQNAGTYVYYITYTNILGTESVNKGTVLLIR